MCYVCQYKSTYLCAESLSLPPSLSLSVSFSLSLFLLLVSLSLFCSCSLFLPFSPTHPTLPIPAVNHFLPVSPQVPDLRHRTIIPTENIPQSATPNPMQLTACLSCAVDVQYKVSPIGSNMHLRV